MVTQVHVKDGAVWAGGDAYPLRNISHVGRRSLPPVQRNYQAQRERLTKRIRNIAIWGGLLCLVTGGVATPVVGWMLWEVNRQRSQLVDVDLPGLHALIISTAGTQQETVWSADAQQIDYIARQITEAIRRPDVIHNNTYNIHKPVNFQTVNKHYKFIQEGNGNIGFASSSGTGNITAGG
ncbi:DUF6232 family protein [Streptomyces cacaoi]|nr:DUF6232 family protein [Streptomyces cacaoi]